jgi:hypothetical protein
MTIVITHQHLVGFCIGVIVMYFCHPPINTWIEDVKKWIGGKLTVKKP